MLKEFFKKSENGKDKKRQIENIVVFIIILIITVLIINSMWSSDGKENTENNTDTSKVLAQTSMSTDEDDLETKLEEILETINGVGKVKVLIKYSETSSVVAMYNETTSESTTTENDGDGGNKDVKETENKKEKVIDKEGVLCYYTSG